MIVVESPDNRTRYASIDSDALRPRPDALHNEIVSEDRAFGENVDQGEHDTR